MCGDGTTLDGDTCVGTGSGSGSGATCGTGTHLEGTTCVPDQPGPTAAPTITTMTPDHAGVTGYILFTIDGTGFAGADVTSLHVYFGDTTPGMNGELGQCEAQIGAATSTEITGEVPPACNLSLQVTVQTNIGSATTGFHYDALFAADGDNDFGSGGDLYLIDPYAALYYDIGPLQDAAGHTYNLDGMAFASDGTLYGVTTGNSQADTALVPQLVTISLVDFSVTAVAPLKDAAGNAYFVTDIKSSGTQLYGWGYKGTDDTQSMLKINTTTGKVTRFGAAVADTYGVGGLAVDGTGALVVAANGASGSDTMITATGALQSVNMGNGSLSSMTTLDYPIAAPIQAMTYVGPVLVAAIDNGTYGTLVGAPLHGETLAVIDPTGSTIVSPAFELPAQLGAQSKVSALDMSPSTATIGRTLANVQWSHLSPATAIGH